MEQEIFAKQLEEITNRISYLEHQYKLEDNNWWKKFNYGDNWPTKNIYLARKAIWESIKRDIERKINLIKESQISVREIEKSNYNKLLIQFNDSLGKVEEKIELLKANIAIRQEGELILEKRRTIGFTILIVVLIILGFLAYQKYESRNKNKISGEINIG
ncbi:MAG: hypothetical protein LBR43_03595 [Spiroplasmataceae bacterium]|jgi:hypothetical protein|nr:hypothetical protein [Spiroplasmataceae bacterium]